MTDPTVAAETCVALGATEHQFETFPGRDIALGPLTVTRVLPVKGKRLVGPWCFLDRFGPLTFENPSPMDVGAHPHMGLQTVTWLHDGELVHYDSLGHESLLRPGGVNVMTSGAAIAHAERTPLKNSGRLSGVQLWVALPDRGREMSALFQHVERVPLNEQRGGIVQMFAGSLGSLRSPATHHAGIFGGDVQVHPGAALDVPLEVAYEYAALVLNGDCSLEGQPLQERVLYYLGANRSGVCFTSRSGGRLLLIGGPPFPEKILMWWNFVARTPQEIADARDRLGGAAAVWRGDWLFGAAPRRAEPRQVCESEPGQLIAPGRCLGRERRSVQPDDGLQPPFQECLRHLSTRLPHECGDAGPFRGGLIRFSGPSAAIAPVWLGVKRRSPTSTLVDFRHVRLLPCPAANSACVALQKARAVNGRRSGNRWRSRSGRPRSPNRYRLAGSPAIIQPRLFRPRVARCLHVTE